MTVDFLSSASCCLAAFRSQFPAELLTKKCLDVGFVIHDKNQYRHVDL